MAFHMISENSLDILTVWQLMHFLELHQFDLERLEQL